MLAVGTTLQGGKYRIEGKIGMGGFGITYRASHELLGTTVVIKEYFPRQITQRDSITFDLTVIESESAQEIFDSGKRSFLAEARFLYTLKNPNIVSVRDIFEEHNTAYTVMEFLEGHNLKEELSATEGRKFSDARVVEVGNALVSALEFLHGEGICHLDIKPSNVMACDNGRIVLIDFGAARQGTSIATQSFHSLSIDYAPPELMREKDFGPESDIFELGVMFYELLTGKLPPRAVERLIGDDWIPTDIPVVWQDRIRAATRLRREERPKDIRAWWEADTIRAKTAAVVVEKRVSVPPPPLAPLSMPPREEPRSRQAPMLAFAGVAALVVAGGVALALRNPQTPPTSTPTRQEAAVVAPVVKEATKPRPTTTPEPKRVVRATPKPEQTPAAKPRPTPEVVASVKATPIALKPSPKASIVEVVETPKPTPTPNAMATEEKEAVSRERPTLRQPPIPRRRPGGGAGPIRERWQQRQKNGSGSGQRGERGNYRMDPKVTDEKDPRDKHSEPATPPPGLPPLDPS